MFIMLCHKLCVFFAFNRHNLQGPVSRDFMAFFYLMNRTHQGPLLTWKNGFANIFIFEEIMVK